MSKPQSKSRITLSKSAKRVAATKYTSAECQNYIRSELDAERAAFMAKFAKVSRKTDSAE